MPNVTFLPVLAVDSNVEGGAATTARKRVSRKHENRKSDANIKKTHTTESHCHFGGRKFGGTSLPRSQVLWKTQSEKSENIVLKVGSDLGVKNWKSALSQNWVGKSSDFTNPFVCDQPVTCQTVALRKSEKGSPDSGVAPSFYSACGVN